MFSNDVLNAWSTWKERNEGFTEGQLVDIDERRQTTDAGQDEIHGHPVIWPVESTSSS
jgi:hypothetical protein